MTRLRSAPLERSDRGYERAFRSGGSSLPKGGGWPARNRAATLAGCQPSKGESQERRICRLVLRVAGGQGLEAEAPPGLPGWLKVSLVVAGVIVAVFVLLVALGVGGLHGPGMHQR